MNESIDKTVRKTLSVLCTETPLHVRFDRYSGIKTVYLSSPLALQQHNAHNKPVLQAIFPKQGLLPLNTRFSLYKDKNYNYIMNRLHNRKKAIFKLNQRMTKRRTVLLPNKRPYLISGWSGVQHSVFKLQSNSPLVPETENKQKNQSVPDVNSVENVFALEVPGEIIKRSLYTWKRRFLTKEDLDNELDAYMANPSFVPETESKRKNRSDQSVPDVNSVENLFALEVPADIIYRSLYTWKRRRFLTKEDLDNELDAYMADIKLKED